MNSLPASLLWPPEWHPHEATVVIWPGRKEVWSPYLSAAREEYLRAINTILHFEPVILVAEAKDADALLFSSDAHSLTTLNLPTNDAWSRDSFPLSVLDGKGEAWAVDFEFNSWGGKYEPFDDDRELGRRAASALGIPRLESTLVLEGGSLTVDGQGTAIVVERTILNENRNPLTTRSDVEEALLRLLGIEAIVWLPFGLLDDTDTDGHVDNVAAFVAPGRVICQARGKNADDDWRLADNVACLTAARDARGRQLEVIEVPWLPYSPLGNGARPASYINLYFVNCGVIVPVVGAPTDDQALEMFSELFSSRSVVPTPASAISYGGGGVHCITQPIFKTADKSKPAGRGKGRER